MFGLEKAVAWRITEGGRVGGVFGGSRASTSDSIWEFPGFVRDLTADAKNRVGRITNTLEEPLIYCTETGRVLQSTHALHHPYALQLYQALSGQDYDRMGWHNALCEANWNPVPGTTSHEGWVKDPEGRCRLWVPVEWRESWSTADWIRSATTQFSIVENQPVIIKF